jgi:asparagine synthase (glutamine-hydrolysing)
MCGIVGVASTTPQKDKSWLPPARDQLAHRGPDDAGEWWSPDGRVGFGHRRLSILDLSPSGHQPMVDPNLGLSIVFNGEIYNHNELRDELKNLGHCFRSSSDTEVIIHAYRAWGVNFLDHLNGMFALAIYDSANSTLLVARDRAGEKPLYFRSSQGTVHFSSELKALLSIKDLPRRISPEMLDNYLAFGFVATSGCILEGFNKLPPAHLLQFNTLTGSLEISKYWTLPSPCEESADTNERLLETELENLLEESVAKQLVADVPVGVLLSGGIDSSLITAIASRHTNHLRTFTVGFPGSPSLDETSYSRIVARHFKTEHLEILADQSSSDLVPLLARQFDEPIVDSSMLPTWMVSNLVQQHCKVVLGGDGGDELFGGYPNYKTLLNLKTLSSVTPRYIVRKLTQLANRVLPTGQKGVDFLRKFDSSLSNGIPFPRYIFDPLTRRALLPNLAISHKDTEFRFARLIPNSQDIIDKATRLDFIAYLPEDILVKVDRASMANSLEVRAPFLDRHVIEFAFGKVPAKLKVTKTGTKILLKQLAKRLLPQQLNINRKQGFSIPLSTWLKSGPFRELFWQVLTDKECLFDVKTTRRLLSNQDKGKSNSERLFSLVLFELWRREYKTHL